MKKLITLMLALHTVFSFSADLCKEKQIGTAAGVAANDFDSLNIDFIKFQSGRWTKMVSDNTGTDLVTLGVTYLDGEEYTKVKYKVSARQIGNTSDCVITSVQMIESK